MNNLSFQTAYLGIIPKKKDEFNERAAQNAAIFIFFNRYKKYNANNKSKPEYLCL